MTIEIDEQCEKITEKIIEQSRSLIEINYWDSLTIAKLNRWLGNFENKEEKYLAAMLLYRLIYRSRDATISLGKDIFHSKLPQILEDTNIYRTETISEWLRVINSSRDARSLPFRFSTISNVDRRPVKSSALIYSQLEDAFFDKNIGWSCDHYNELPTKIKAIVLFDDIIGTGEQFEKFYIERNLDKSHLKIIYLPFAAVSRSYTQLEEKYENLIISPVEIIKDEHSFFTDTNRLLNQSPNFTPDTFKSFYLEFCRKKGINVNDKLGKGELALTYIFNDSTPNNNLAVLWHKEDGWHTLFKR